MIDIHCHILPNISGDDGAASIEQSLSIARKLVESGFHKVIATPHCIEGEFNLEPEVLTETADRLNGIFLEADIPLEVYLGCEILFHNEVLNNLKAGKAISLNASDYVLIELPMREFPEATLDLIKELVGSGLVPIIAHPERNRCISADPRKVNQLLEAGAVLQLNLCSLIGVYGETAQKTAELILDMKAYHFVGTDLHNDKLNIKGALTKLRAITGAGYYHKLTEGHPQAILDNRVFHHQVELRHSSPVLKNSEIKNRRKKRLMAKYLLTAAASLILITSGGLAYADYRIQKEMEAAFRDLDQLSLTQVEIGSGESLNTAESSKGTKENSASQASSANESSQTVTTKSESGEGAVTEGKVESNTAPKGDASSGSTLKKLTLSEKAEAYKLVMSKLSPAMISKMRGLAEGGFTSEEKREIKSIFYSNFTPDEQHFLMDLYLKGRD